MYKIENNKIFFNNNFNINSLDFINCGANAKIYRLKLNNEYYALKIFNIPNYWKLENFDKMTDIKISSFISPIKLCYINNKFNGYIMKLCKGQNLHKEELEINIGDFIKSSNKLFSDTDKLSELKYLIKDENMSNIMFDNGFKMIDIDFYEDYSNKFDDIIKSIDDIKKINKKHITKLLIKIFIRKTKIEETAEIERLKIDCITEKNIF